MTTSGNLSPSDDQASMIMDEPVLDCRGVEITIGATVVVAGHHRLHEDQVRAVEITHLPDGRVKWIWVRLVKGLPTTPERLAVVS